VTPSARVRRSLTGAIANGEFTVATASGIEYAELNDKWNVDRVAYIYKSPIEGRQGLIFNQPARDGSISAQITVAESKSLQKRESMCAAIVVRYQNRADYYFAGVGGFNGRYFLAKRVNGNPELIAKVGKRESLELGQPYTVQIRFVGNQLTLSHNGVTQISVLDNKFSSGPWGFHTWRTQAIFERISVDVATPSCFVIMPFASDFNDVYKVIGKTVAKHAFHCIRADERYVTGPIIEDALDQIERADLIVADFTGRNANVFYEAGYARALRKPVIQIAQSVSDLPFDVQHLRTFPYSTKILGDRKLARDLSEAIRATTGFGVAASQDGHGTR
jgi:hypothetical protein